MTREYQDVENIEALERDPRVDFSSSKPSHLEDGSARIYPRALNIHQRAQAICYMVERGHKLDPRGLAETFKEFKAIGWQDSFFHTLEELWDAGVLDASDLPALAAKFGVVIETPKGEPIWAHSLPRS